MIPATAADCPMTEECPGYDRERGLCLIRSGDCEFAPVAGESDQVANAHVDEVSPGDSIGS